MTTKNFITAAELRERWAGSVTIRTLANWRAKRKGPPFVRFGSKVLYPVDKLVEWEAQQSPSNENTK